MFTLPHNTIAILYKQPMDMHLGMFRLQGLISAYKEHNLTKGAFYFFTNRPRTLLKAVWFDGIGICLFSKRLEKGQFSWPSPAIPNEKAWMQIHPSSLALLLNGIELKNARPLHKIWHSTDFSRVFMYNHTRAPLFRSKLNSPFPSRREHDAA